MHFQQQKQAHRPAAPSHAAGDNTFIGVLTLQVLRRWRLCADWDIRCTVCDDMYALPTAC